MMATMTDARLLLVSTTDAAREDLNHALYRAGGEHHVDWVNDEVAAIERASQTMPDMVVINDDLPAANALSLIKALSSPPMSLPVLFMIEPDRIALASQSVLAGARCFLTKPLRADDLAPVVDQILAQQQERVGARVAEDWTGGKTLVFCASKGGTGRTTLAINTAVGLRKKTGDSVVLVEADFAATAIDVALNLRPIKDLSDLLPRLSKMDEELLSAMLTEHSSGLKVLVAPPAGTLMEPVAPSQVRQIIGLLQRMFTWVIVDLGLPLDDTAFSFLGLADRIAISVLPEMVGLRNARYVVEQFRDRGFPKERIWVVINRDTMAGGISQEDVERRLGLPVAYKIPDDQPLATHSINSGVPFILSRRRSALIRNYRKFVYWVEREFAEMEAAEAAAEPIQEVKRGLLSIRPHSVRA